MFPVPSICTNNLLLLDSSHSLTLPISEFNWMTFPGFKLMRLAAVVQHIMSESA